VTDAQLAPRLGFVLPGDWWHVDLTSEQTAQADARALSRALGGRSDERAQVRHQLEGYVLQAGRKAREAKASDFYFALEMLPGVPIPASLAVYWPEVPFGLSIEAGAQVAAHSLASTIQRKDPVAEIETWGDAGDAVIRVAKKLAGPIARSAGIAADAELSVTYWLIRKGTSGPALLQFTTQLVDEAEHMITLFDAIVGTVAWTEPDPS
jgi:hypothetical protein